jgi:hypothetical protein
MLADAAGTFSARMMRGFSNPLTGPVRKPEPQLPRE